MPLHRLILLATALSTTLWSAAVLAQETAQNCASASDRACVAAAILRDTKDITESRWRDAALRDVAVSMTYDGRIDDAIAVIPTIGNPDTQAMTVRGIGMAVALYGSYTPEQLREIFTKLSQAGAKITQPAARAIAETYVAMSQAFAGLDDDAWATASAMSNPALKHKAFGETAEIQAERGELQKALASIEKIDAASYRNKSYQNVAEILIKAKKFDDALVSAQHIDNPTKRAQTMQKILHAQEEKTRGVRNDVANGTNDESGGE